MTEVTLYANRLDFCFATRGLPSTLACMRFQYAGERTSRTDVERIWHMYDSKGQILVLALNP